MIPRENGNRGDSYLDESEVVTRMMFVMKEFAIYDLKTIKWNIKWEDQGIDSLEQTALITSFEHEFHTIFEDNVFDHFENFDQVKDHLTHDIGAF